MVIKNSSPDYFFLPPIPLLVVDPTSAHTPNHNCTQIVPKLHSVLFTLAHSSSHLCPLQDQFVWPDYLQVGLANDAKSLWFSQLRWRNTTQYNMTYDVKWHDTTCHDTIQHDMTQYNMPWHNTTWHDTIRRDMTRYNITWHNTTGHDTIQPIFSLLWAKNGKL